MTIDLPKLPALAAAAFLSLGAATAAVAQATINVLVVQEDSDPQSVERGSRIQNAVLSTLSQTLNAPAYQSRLAQQGIGGMDVYDETAVTVEFYGQDRTRRTDQELVSLSRQIRNPMLDVLVPYTLYARAVENPYTNVVSLRMSMSYRALSVRDGRFLGGDNLDLDPAGIPFTGCATSTAGTQADPHCVQEFVAENGERLARVAGNQLAIQLASLLPAVAPVTPAPVAGADTGAKTVVEGADPVAVAPSSSACANLPVTRMITFRGYDQRQLTAVESNIRFWDCAMDMDVADSDFGEMTYQYQTRADAARLIRNIRLMNELLGVTADIRDEGANTIVVEALGVRSN